MTLSEFEEKLYALNDHSVPHIYVVEENLDAVIDDVSEHGHLYKEECLCTVYSSYKAERYLSKDICDAQIEGWFICDDAIYVSVTGVKK